MRVSFFDDTQVHKYSINSNKLGKTHVLKRDFMAILRGGSSSSSNEGGVMIDQIHDFEMRSREAVEVSY